MVICRTRLNVRHHKKTPVCIRTPAPAIGGAVACDSAVDVHVGLMAQLSTASCREPATEAAATLAGVCKAKTQPQKANKQLCPRNPESFVPSLPKRDPAAPTPDIFLHLLAGKDFGRSSSITGFMVGHGLGSALNYLRVGCETGYNRQRKTC